MRPGLKEATYPIPAHPTWWIMDNSKMKEFMSCPRSYFFRYILGWDTTQPNIHLEFGTAWHLLQEHLRLHGYSQSSQDEAFQKFLTHYRKYFDPATDMDNAPKNPANALIALDEYCKRYAKQDEDLTTLYTEVSAITPISNTRDMTVRIDFIGLHKTLGLLGMDYKTGQRFSSMWVSQWSTDMQMKLYTHTLQMYFPGRKVFGMKVDGVIFYKAQQKDLTTRNRLIRVPLGLDDEIMSAWLFDVNYWYDRIEEEMHHLSESGPDDSTLTAFPKNPTSCTRWNRLCSYHSLCMSWANPLQRCFEVPRDLQVKWWDPTNPEDKPPAKYTFGRGEIKEIDKEESK